MYFKAILLGLVSAILLTFSAFAMGPELPTSTVNTFSIEPFLQFEQALAPMPAPRIEYEEPAPVESEVEYEAVQTTYITTDRVNFRSDPSTDNPRIMLVQAGRQVEVLDFLDGEWFRVEFDGIVGYMASQFLREMPAPGEVGTVELIEWSVVRNIIPQNVPLTVVDTRTGLTWQMISFSHGNHADVWPATSDDTEIMRQAFGGWTWTPRPIVLIVGDRTFAASMNGMPHGGGSGTNGFNGHVCMHFVGSRTHNGNRSHERDHQNAIQEAYRTASNW